MRELEEGFRDVSGEEEKRKKKKKKRVKDEKTDEEGSACAELSRGSLTDATDIRLGLTSKKDDKKKCEKRRRDVEATGGGDGVTGKDGEGINREEVHGEEERKMKKKERRRGEANTGKQDGVSAVKSGIAGDVDEGIKTEKNDEEVGTDGRDPGVANSKREKLVEDGIDLQETKKRKRKDKTPKVGNNLEPFEADVVGNVSENQVGGLARRMEVRPVEHQVQDHDGESLKETKMKRKKRDRNGMDTESFFEQRATKEEPYQQKPFAEKERIEDVSCSDYSCDHERRKILEEENSLEAGEVNKRKKAKAKVLGHQTSILNSPSGRGFGTVNNPAVTAEEVVGDGNQKMQSSSVTRDKKKTRKKKKNKDGTAENTKISIEQVSNKEVTSENTYSKKISKTSANIETPSVRNITKSNTSAKAETKKKVKKVSFSGHVEVFTSTSHAKNNDQSNEDGLTQGKRFSPEEDEMIKQAVFDYIEENQLGEDGLKMVLNCKSYPQVRNCWKEIGAGLPWRPCRSIYYRAHTLFQRSEERKWEPEELDLVRRYYSEHGPKWKEMAELLGKHRVHVKDAWRRIKLPDAKKGTWSQEEYQALFDLVNVDLQLKAFTEKETKHGMLRENISWSAISKKLSSRHEATCCLKWYGQLTSSMVTQGLWDDADDYHLIDELLKLDSCCVEDVDWDNLLDNRSGDICLKRWKQMTRHIGGHIEKSFMEQVELLATRYCPNMLPYRIHDPKDCDDDVNELETPGV